MPAFTPQDFVSKWKRVTSREKQTYQEHFIDLCRLVDHQTPNEADYRNTVSMSRPVLHLLPSNRLFDLGH